MKCPRCGFEAESKFCPECGAPLTREQAGQPNQPQKNPYHQAYQPPRPLEPVPSTARLVQVPPKTNKGAVIAIVCVICGVVLTGIVIAVLSGIFYHKNILGATESSAVDPIVYDYDDPTDDQLDDMGGSWIDSYYSDFMTVEIGKFSDFTYGKIGLTNVRNDGGEYIFTVEIENPTDRERSYRLDEISLVGEVDAPDTRFTSLLKDTLDGKKYDSGFFTLASGDKATYTCAYKGPEADVDLELYVNFNCYDNNDKLCTGNVKYNVKSSDY